MKRYELTEAQWRQVQPLLPARRKTGRSATDDHTIINAIVWHLRTGARWRDLPDRYGPWQRVATQYYRWRASGLWDRLLSALPSLTDEGAPVEWEIVARETSAHGDSVRVPR